MKKIEILGIGCKRCANITGRARQAVKELGIDGCSVACAKKTLEHAGFTIDEYVQATDLGIEKNHDLNLDLSDVGKVTDDLASQISKKRGQV